MFIYHEIYILSSRKGNEYLVKTLTKNMVIQDVSILYGQKYGYYTVWRVLE